MSFFKTSHVYMYIEERRFLPGIDTFWYWPQQLSEHTVSLCWMPAGAEGDMRGAARALRALHATAYLPMPCGTG